jgi:formate-nitrite transporter family protein
VESPPVILNPEQPSHDESEKKEVEERSAPSSSIVYGAIVKEGEEELARSSSALFWSGLAAGLAMGFSLIAQGVLSAQLPESDWKPLITKLGYSAGFVIVILGRQQLFTENTLTPVLPLLKGEQSARLSNVMRLWAVVLVANLLGAVAFAYVAGSTRVFDSEIREAFADIGHRALSHDFATILLRGIFGGWLVALLVWLLPFAESARLWVIVFVSYLIGIGGFTHVIAGSIDVFTVAAMGERGWSEALVGYTLPALIGNVIGGVALVACLNHAQVASGKGQTESGKLRA